MNQADPVSMENLPKAASGGLSLQGFIFLMALFFIPVLTDTDL